MTVPWRVHACRPLTPRPDSMGREAVRQRALTTDLLPSRSVVARVRAEAEVSASPRLVFLISFIHGEVN